MEGLLFGGPYIRREICVSKSVRLILGGKFASQNRLGYSLQCRQAHFERAKPLFESFNMAFSRAKTFACPMKTPALQANWARL